MLKALKLLSRKKRTISEIRGKLFERYSDYAEDVEKVIKRLIEMRYLDDKAYVEAFTRDRVKFRPRGKRIVALELRKKGIDSTTIQNGISGLDIDEFDIACTIFEQYVKKSSFKKAKNPKASMLRHIASRGIPFSIALRVISERLR